MALVNMFGGINLEDTQVDNRELLLAILLELKKLNAHMAHMTDQHITDEDVSSEEER